MLSNVLVVFLFFFYFSHLVSVTSLQLISAQSKTSHQNNPDE